MYHRQIADIVKHCGGFRERVVLNSPHTVEKSETWNDEHKVLNISELTPGEDGYRYGFQVDLVTKSICG